MSAVEQGWGNRVTTAFARQGHHGQAADVAKYAPPDVTIECIGESLHYDYSTLLEAPLTRRAL